jgi:hypothetical protein
MALIFGFSASRLEALVAAPAASFSSAFQAIPLLSKPGLKNLSLPKRDFRFLREKFSVFKSFNNHKLVK